MFPFKDAGPRINSKEADMSERDDEIDEVAEEIAVADELFEHAEARARGIAVAGGVAQYRAQQIVETVRDAVYLGAATNFEIATVLAEDDFVFDPQLTVDEIENALSPFDDEQRAMLQLCLDRENHRRRR
jgi:hypothetical protein